MKSIVIWIAALSCTAQGAVVIGDSVRGAELFKSQNCVTCHSVNGDGGKSAPDLGKRSSRGYAPSELAALMWNHAPKMWSAMDEAKISRPKISTAQAADLFAYFYAVRFFDKRGDAGRGRQVFVGKGCADCHNITSGNSTGGPPVLKWESVGDPIELARQMWNHSATMKEQMKAKGIKTPTVTAAEMNDISVYLQNLPQTRNLKPQFSPASAETGEVLFQAKGCTSCHKGAQSLPKAGTFQSSADFAAAMWNHPGKTKQGSELRPEEMKRLVGFLWAKQFEQEGGTAAKGAKVFESKGCATCHASGAAPKLALGARANSYEMIAVLWGHGPSMQKEMKGKGVAWPRFENTEMADLLAHLRQAR